MPSDRGQGASAATPEPEPERRPTPPTPVLSGVKAGLFFLLGTVGAATSVLSVETPEALAGWLLLAVASVIGGVIAVTAAAGLGAGDWTVPFPLPSTRWVRRLLRVAVAAGLAVVVGFGAVTLVPPVIDRIWPPDCAQPVELRVLTSPSNLSPYQEVADAYEQWTADGNGGCPTANVFVYAPPVPWAQDALRGGWAAPRLAEWPRPDVWLPDTVEHANEVQAANRTGQDFRLAIGREPIAETPVVVAVRGEELAGDLSWWDVFQAAEQADQGLVRSAPHVGGSGLLSTVAIYTSTAGPSGEIASAEQAAAVERRIARTLDRGYRLDDTDDEVLLQYSEMERPAGVGDSELGLIVSEQAMIRHNQRLATHEGCAIVAAPHPARLRARYPRDTPSLLRHVVRLEWGDAAGPQRTVGVEFERWLSSDPGRRALADVALRPPGVAAREPIGAACGAVPDVELAPPPSPEVVAEVMGRYGEAQRPGRLLLLLDSSGSMRQEVAAGRSRMDMAAESVRGMVTTMTSRDEFGLWEFPGGGEVMRELVPLVPAPTGPADGYRTERQQATDAALEQIRVGGGTPLYRAIVAGVEELLPADPARVEALLVITDGEDSENGLTPQELVQAVDGKEIRVFVIAVGEASCASEGLSAVTDRTGGSCYDAVFDTLDRTLTDVAASVWGGVSDAG